MAIVYKKTAKGQTEIETRVNRLTPRLRTSLILVDGRRTDEELRAMILIEADTVLNTLLTQGFIEIAEDSSTHRSSSAPTHTPSGHELPPRKLDESKRSAVRFLNDHLGPSAESLALKIERSQSWSELKPHLEMAEHFLRAGSGADVARDFAEKFLETPSS